MSKNRGALHYAVESCVCWDYIATHFVDRHYGDWGKVLNREGGPYTDHSQVGPWEGPYHHRRAGFAMLRRLAGEPA